MIFPDFCSSRIGLIPYLLGIKTDIYSPRANVIQLKGDTMVSFARVRGYLCLLGCRGGVKFGTSADSRNFDGFCVGMELLGIVNIRYRSNTV